MRDVLVGIAVSLAVGLGGRGVFRLIRTVRHTSLVAAAWWAVGSQMILTVAWAGMLVTPTFSPGIADQIWYFVTVTSVCPLVAVLGARRGRIVDWSLFVLLPLIAVLEWPALAQWSRTWSGQRLELEMPSQIALSVVLLLGAGNFWETRFAWSANWWCLSWLWLVTHLGEPLGGSLAWVAGYQLLFWWSVEIAIRRKTMTTGWHRVWLDFRDHYGIVWASRVRARVNEVAVREQWQWRLESAGFQPATPDAPLSADPHSDPRVDHTFRWLLKPFVDAEWIDARLSFTDHRQLTANNPPNPACPREPPPTQSRDHDALH